MAVVTAAIGVFDNVAPVLSLGVLYVFAVLPVAVIWGAVVAIPVALASMLAFNWFFLPPVHTFRLAHRQDWFALAVYVVTAIVVGVLASRARRRAAEAEQRERESALVADIASELLRGTRLQDELGQIERRTADVLGVASVRIVLESRDQAGSHESPHPLTVNAERVGTLYTTDQEEPDLDVQRRLLPALASLLAVAAERERLAREALEAEALRRSDTIKTAIIQAVSHDLRTPLATIETALDGLESGLFDLGTEDRRALLETIRAEQQRLKRVVENLLDLSRIQAEAAPPSFDLWSADELIGQALDDVGDAGRVEVHAPADLPPVRVDALQIERVLANILENALKFSPPNERVHVRVTATRKELIIRITDHGPGIPATERERIFEPFHRVAGAPDSRGAGLGLAIASGFARANGGRLWVESHEGQGASFAVALPVVDVPVSVP